MAPTKGSKLFLILLRVVVGWFFLYQGITMILNPQWSLLPFIQNAQTFPDFYAALTASTLIPYINYLFKGLYILIGGLLILGLFVRPAALLGALIMLFLYFPLLKFPYVDSVYYIVDQHLVMVFVLMYLFAVRAGEFFGLGSMFHFSRY
jgi:thiosulfate dehydrogenase (quinone) large subunit